ncbi:MAG: Hsp20/alpha crystallin family protein [Chloroflexota bacterium]|nr:MAG: hypothetical protein B6243_02600 [Anaerolineaceae bacterium 4572_5.2]RLD11403.1 MAG: Hsp20/alpha crystallin family protein [Chloroflexota bacterium]
MAAKNKEMEVQKQETIQKESERTRECPSFVPQADIYETDENIVVLLDMPGVEKDNISVGLEKNILSVNGYVDLEYPEDYSLALAEYRYGDYERSFRVSDRVEQDNIEARYKDGVLRLTLPKAEEAKERKIPVKIG